MPAGGNWHRSERLNGSIYVPPQADSYCPGLSSLFASTRRGDPAWNSPSMPWAVGENISMGGNFSNCRAFQRKVHLPCVLSPLAPSNTDESKAPRTRIDRRCLFVSIKFAITLLYSGRCGTEILLNAARSRLLRMYAQWYNTLDI